LSAGVSQTQPASSTQRDVRVWDLPTRLFHWTLVVLIALQFATAEFGLLSMDWHYRFGYATLALILFRVVWGFVGSQTSRFADFVRGPMTIARYLQTQWSVGAQIKHAQTSVGHNALGGWSVLSMLGVVLLQAISGLFSSDGIDEDGPFSASVSNATVKWMTSLHHLGETALLILIGLHIAAVLLHWLLKHDNLIAPMFSGRKRIDPARPISFAGNGRALLLFAIASAAVAVLAYFGA
jgi:cytochrome b